MQPKPRNIIEQVKKADFSLDQLQQIVKNAVYNDSSPGTIFFPSSWGWN